MPTPVNTYTTLVEWKAYKNPNGMATSAADDTVIERLLAAASRAVDEFTGRKFYPRVQTMQLDTPESNELWLGDDLLALATLTNGDGTVLTAANFSMVGRNRTPYYIIKAKTGTIWQLDGSDADGAISVAGVWGYHPDYANAWSQGTLLNGAITSSATALTVDSESAFNAGDILKIDDELMLLTATSASTLTVQRNGFNGSTAAIHADNAPVYRWLAHAPVVEAVNEIVGDIYEKRTGQFGSGAATITAAGVVIRPTGFPQSAIDLLQPLIRLL